MDRNIEIRANANYPILTEGHSDNKIKNAQFHAYCKGATEQKKIDYTNILNRCVVFDKLGRPIRTIDELIQATEQ